MKNIEMKVDKNTLVIKVDLTKRHGKSASGKTTIIASTEGNQKIGVGDVTIGLNVYTKED